MAKTNKNLLKFTICLVIFSFLAGLALQKAAYAQCGPNGCSAWGGRGNTNSYQGSKPPTQPNTGTTSNNRGGGFVTTAKISVGSNSRSSNNSHELLSRQVGLGPNRGIVTNRLSSGEKKYQVENGSFSPESGTRASVTDRYSGDLRGKIEEEGILMRNLGGEDHLVKRNDPNLSLGYDKKNNTTIVRYEYDSTREYIVDWAAKNLEGYSPEAALAGKVVNPGSDPVGTTIATRVMGEASGQNAVKVVDGKIIYEPISAESIERGWKEYERIQKLPYNERPLSYRLFSPDYQGAFLKVLEE